MLNIVHGGDPINMYGFVDLIKFHAFRLCSSRLKSQPFVKSSECPGMSPILAASRFTLAGE